MADAFAPKNSALQETIVPTLGRCLDDLRVRMIRGLKEAGDDRKVVFDSEYHEGEGGHERAKVLVVYRPHCGDPVFFIKPIMWTCASEPVAGPGNAEDWTFQADPREPEKIEVTWGVEMAYTCTWYDFQVEVVTELELSEERREVRVSVQYDESCTPGDDAADELIKLLVDDAL
jgi:hypothetical protein